MHPPAVPDTSGEIVFAPVPTREEVLAISREAQQARAGRARLFVLVVFLAGVIVAGGLGIALVRQHAEETIMQAQAETERLTRRLAERDAEIARQSEQIAALSRELDGYGGFRSITTLQQQADRLEHEITNLLAEPSRRDAPARLREFPPEVEWLDQTVSALSVRRERLEQMKSDVQAWPPRPVALRPD